MSLGPVVSGATRRVFPPNRQGVDRAATHQGRTQTGRNDRTDRRHQDLQPRAAASSMPSGASRWPSPAASSSPSWGRVRVGQIDADAPDGRSRYPHHRHRHIFGPRPGSALSDRERSLLRRTRIGFVFQAFNLLPTLTAAENVALPLLLLGGANRRDALKQASASLDRVGLGDRAGHFPDEMSGGEMQRAAVARALVGDPDVVLVRRADGEPRLVPTAGRF